jgi:hypothetical protein
LFRLRSSWRTVAIIAAVALITGQASPGAVAAPAAARPPVEKLPPLSGAYEYGRLDFGTGLTECPQAGKGLDRHPQPLDRRVKDAVERKSEGSSDLRANQDFSCFPQDETSIAANPRNGRNVLGGANDYRLGWGTSGFYSSTNSGSDWYDGVIPFPSLPSGDNLDGGGDPAIVFDRSGIAYYADINFNRTDDTSGVFVSRSTNGGFTWSRPCVPIATSTGLVCGGTGDPRRPGDGVVVFTQDNDSALNGSVPAHDKEYIASGPRPAGVAAQCFNGVHVPTACDSTLVGADRLYVTWTVFADEANIVFSFSDDEARSWSPTRPISGSAPFCIGFVGTNCDFNQFSTPTVSPESGYLYVAFENFNTADENQYLLVRSQDGGATFQGPFFITPVFDVNYPRAGTNGGRPDCTTRGQGSGRPVLTNSCFRVNSGGNVVVDKRGGAFADDLYLVMSDNRNGTPSSSNADIFLFKSTNGGTTWIGPSRVNTDPSGIPANRDCGARAFIPVADRVPCPVGVNTGNDQWFPWVDIGEKGDLVVVFEDRRLDTASTASEWPTSRARPGNYLVWYWGAQCEINSTATVSATTTTIPSAARDCLASAAGVVPAPTAPIDPSGSFPGGGPTYLGDFSNFGISDIPSNWDYTFRAGIFAGDYSNVTVVNDRAHTLWTDARNGRSSRTQAGRNPICEQSDVFYESWDADKKANGQNSPQSSDSLFLVTPCPAAAKDNGNRDRGNDEDNSNNNGSRR